jgi:hypothetical protein
MIEWMKKWSGMVLLLGMIFAAVFFHPFITNGPPIRSDGLGYHLWTRAILNWDLNFCQVAQKNLDIGEIQGSITPPHPKTGICQNKYPPGLALLRLPFMAPFTDLDESAPVVNKRQHQLSVILSALALFLVGLFCLKSLLVLNVRPQLAQFTVLVGTFGTGLFHYATFDNSFTHIYSALGISLLLWSLCKKAANGFLTSVCSLFLILIRNTNVFLVFFFLAADFYKRLSSLKSSDSKADVKWIRDLLLSGGVAIGLAVCIQLGYNFYATKMLTFNSYAGTHESFNWSHSNSVSIFFSYERGLMNYTPLLAITLIAGLFERGLRLATGYYLLMNLFFAGLYGFWHSWGLGEGFGHRGFVELCPIFIVILGIALEKASFLGRKILIVSSLLCSWLTVQLMWGYWRGTLSHIHPDFDSYWGHLLLKQNFQFGLISVFAWVFLFSIWKEPRQNKN